MTLGAGVHHANLRSTPTRGTYPRFCSGNNTLYVAGTGNQPDSYVDRPGKKPAGKFFHFVKDCTKLAGVRVHSDIALEKAIRDARSNA